MTDTATATLAPAADRAAHRPDQKKAQDTKAQDAPAGAREPRRSPATPDQEAIDARITYMRLEASGDVDEQLAGMREIERHRRITAERIARAEAKAQRQRERAEYKAKRALTRGEYKARRIELKAQNMEYRKIRLDVHGRPKPLMRGWLHLFAAPLALAGGIVLICLAPTTALKWACAVYMTCSLILFGNSALYHLGDWSPKVTDVLRRIDHTNIFLLIAGTYTPIAFALEPQWRNTIIVSIWSCVAVAMVIHIVWIGAPRALYTAVYVVFGVSGIAYMGLFWRSPWAGPAVVWLILAGGACYIAGAVVYARRRPDPWPTVFGFHEVFHLGTVLGYACHMVAVFLVVCAMR